MLGLGAYPVCSEWVEVAGLYGEPHPLRALMTRWFLDNASDEELGAVTACRTELAVQSGQSTIRQLRVATFATNPVTLTRLYQILSTEPGVNCAADGTVLAP